MDKNYIFLSKKQIFKPSNLYQTIKENQKKNILLYSFCNLIINYIF